MNVAWWADKAHVSKACTASLLPDKALLDRKYRSRAIQTVQTEHMAVGFL